MKRTNLSVREQLSRDRARGQMQSMRCTAGAKESFKRTPYSCNAVADSQNRSESILNHSVRKLSATK